VKHILATLLSVLAIQATNADEDIRWEKAYSQLLNKNPGVREKVESGGATMEQVIAWMKKQARSKGTRGGK